MVKILELHSVMPREWLEAEYKKLKEVLECLNKNNMDLRTENQKLQERLEDAEHSAKQDSEALREVNEQLSDLCTESQVRLPLPIVYAETAGLGKTISVLNERLKQNERLIMEERNKNEQLMNEFSLLQEKLCQKEQKLKTDQEDISQKERELNQLTTINAGLETTLKDEQEKNATLRSEVVELKKEVTKLNDNLDTVEPFKIKYGELSERVAHYAEEMSEKKKSLPTLGQNNTEEMEIQKFVDFVICHTAKLKDFVPDGLNMSPRSPQSVTPINKNENCMLCHKQPRFAKCSTENCGGIYHEKCILNRFKTKRECPCCHRDSIKFQDEDNE